MSNRVFFPAPSGSPKSKVSPVVIPCFDAAVDIEGTASHVPHMDHFYDNSIQTAIMRDIAIDLEVLGEHLVLLGNQVKVHSVRSVLSRGLHYEQGVGKNKIVDRSVFAS